jgi:hypothetical protein
VSYISCFTVVDEIFNYDWSCCVAGAQVRSSRVRRAQVPDIRPESSKAVTRNFRRHQRAGRRPPLHISTPDYSGILPKVDCWRRNSATNGEENEVSCVVSCSVVQMQARNLPGIG